MAWGRQSNMQPIAGGRGGGGGFFAPSPGFPPPGRTRPPGAVPAPSGRTPPSGWTVPKMPHGQRSRPISERMRRSIEDKARLGLDERKHDYWKYPDAPIRQSWFIEANGWTRCANPNWPSCLLIEPQPTLWDWAGSNAFNGNCANGPDGSCPQGQVSVFDEPLNDSSSFPATTTRVKFTRRNPSNPSRYDFIRTYAKPFPGGAPYPVFRVGRVVLPDLYEDPLAWPEAQPEMEKSYGTRSRAGVLVGAMGAAMPGVEYAPGGPPGGTPIVHPPVPPRPPNKERKEPPFNYGGAGKAYGALTEAGDAAKCYIDAKGGNSGGLGTRGALKEAWRLANDPDAPPLDGQQFMQCLSAANAQDALIGRLSKGAAKAQNRSPYASKRPGGYRGGGWGTRMR